MLAMIKKVSFWTAGIWLTLLLTLVAELLRFHGVLLLDLWAPTFFGTWILWQFYRFKMPKLPWLIWPAALFITIGFGSLLAHSSNMSFGDFAASAFYCIRWISMFGLLLIAMNESKQNRTLILWGVFVLAATLSIAGFIQLQVAPDFTQYEVLGWDPHIGRLLSTWFDPNFVGGFLAFTLPILIGTAYEKKSARPYLIPIGIIILTALALTYSRSSYLALITGLFIFGLLKSWRLLLIGTLVCLIATATIPQLQSRVTSLTEAAQSVFTESYTLPDQSSRLRFESWETGIYLFAMEPIFGHGYNRYKDAAYENKFLTDTDSHSATGSDSSTITIAATTGALGLIAFMTAYLSIALAAWRDRKNAFSSGLLASLAGLAIHSIFVNSLLFPLFMAPFWLVVSLQTLPKVDFSVIINRFKS